MDTTVVNGVLSLSQTHVYYHSGDPLGYIAAWLTLVPIGILIGYTTRFFIDLHDFETFLMGGGQILNEIFNYTLKKIIAQNRPGVWGPGYGMPSSHAQFMGFFAGYFITRLYRYNKKRLLLHQALAVSCIASLVCWSRWYLLYHTAAQVIVGAAVGVPIGILYSSFVILLRSTGLLGQIVTTRLARAAQVNDYNMDGFPSAVQLACSEYNRHATSFLLPVQKACCSDDNATKKSTVDKVLKTQSLLKEYNENFNKKRD